MRRKIPVEAYAYYVSLGQARSYESVAKHFDVSKRSVTKLAAREGWQAKLAISQQQVREKAEAKAQETLEEMNERHLKTMRLVQHKALEVICSLPLSTAMEAVRSLTWGLDRERLIRGEPTDRTALDMEQVIRGEYQRWMSRGDEKVEECNGEPTAQ
jgi:transposase